jgi:glycosyltransferase involved in cell wall biosynthesis
MYDLILVDTEEQKEEVELRAETFIKPACDPLFGLAVAPKTYDLVFVANAPQKKLKGHKWLFDRLEGSGLSVIQIGYNDKEVIKWAHTKNLNITFVGWVPRKCIAMWACRGRIGVVASTDYESCPRVIPEYLKMNLPIVVRDTTRVSDVYVNQYTGRFASDDNFVEVVQDVLKNHSNYSPYWYYETHLSLEVAAEKLARTISEIISSRVSK